MRAREINRNNWPIQDHKKCPDKVVSHLLNKGVVHMADKFWLRCGLLVCGVLLAGIAQADFPSVPKETYEELKLDRSASPKQLHEALVKRYLDPAEGFGKGKYGQYWEPIPFSKYLDPASFYKP